MFDLVVKIAAGLCKWDRTNWLRNCYWWKVGDLKSNSLVTELH